MSKRKQHTVNIEVALVARAVPPRPPVPGILDSALDFEQEALHYNMHEMCGWSAEPESACPVCVNLGLAQAPGGVVTSGDGADQIMLDPDSGEFSRAGDDPDWATKGIDPQPVTITDDGDWMGPGQATEIDLTEVLGLFMRMCEAMELIVDVHALSTMQLMDGITAADRIKLARAFGAYSYDG